MLSVCQKRLMSRVRRLCRPKSTWSRTRLFRNPQFICFWPFCHHSHRPRILDLSIERNSTKLYMLMSLGKVCVFVKHTAGHKNVILIIINCAIDVRDSRYHWNASVSLPLVNCIYMCLSLLYACKLVLYLNDFGG